MRQINQRMHNFDALQDELIAFCGKHNVTTIYLQPGNGGDALICAGIYKLQDDLGLDLAPVPIIDFDELKNSGQSGVIFSGGGILNKFYDLGWAVIREAKEKGFSVFLLPHTVESPSDDGQLPFDENDILFLRDRHSFESVNGAVESVCYLTDDMAFYPTKNFWYDLMKEHGFSPGKLMAKSNLGLLLQAVGRRRFLPFLFHAVHRRLNAFRLDVESADQEKVRKLAYNVDLSKSVGTASKDSWPDNLLVAARFMAFVVIFKKIKTDRLHVGIACSILDVNCE